MSESEDDIEEQIEESQKDHINVFLFQPSMTIINAVKMRPALYDVNLPIDERSKPKRKQLWNEVAGIVNAPVTDVRRRWRALRGRYSRYRRQYFAYLQDVNNDTDIKLPQFQYYRHLKFLEPLMEQQRFHGTESFNFTLPKQRRPKSNTTIVTNLINQELPLVDVFTPEPSNSLQQMYLGVQSDPLDPLNNNNNNDIMNPDEELTIKNYTNLGKMIAIRLRQLKSKRLARKCEIEIMNMMMNAELQDCGEIKNIIMN